MIKRVGPNKYVVMDAQGKKTLSKPMSHARAVKRLRAIEHFKSQDANKGY